MQVRGSVMGEYLELKRGVRQGCVINDRVVREGKEMVKRKGE